MGESGATERRVKKTAKVAAAAVASLLCVLLSALLALQLYLASPLPAKQLSRYLTSHLEEGFTVQQVRLSGHTLVLKKVRLANPAGFPAGDLFSADAVAVAPRWLDLLFGKQRFEIISLDDGKLSLDKNSRGDWNFSHLQQRLAAKKPPKKPPTETFVDRLLIRNGSLSIRGEKLTGMSLQVFNLATAGSNKAEVVLDFEDSARNRYLLKGSARPGKDPALDLSLTAPKLSLRDLTGTLKLGNGRLLRDAKGALQANAVLVNGELRASGIFLFNNVRLPGSASGLPVAGALNFNGGYGLADDTARLTEATLSVDGVARLHAAGTVQGVKKERSFALRADTDEADLAILNLLLPDASRGNLLVGGKIRCESLQLLGDRNGVKKAAGSLRLADGSLSKDGHLLLSGLSGAAILSGKEGGIAATGQLAARRSDPKTLVEELKLPFVVKLSPRLQLASAESPALFARAMGVSLSGLVTYQGERKKPLYGKVAFSIPNLADLNPILGSHDFKAASGSVSGSAELTGSGARDLGGTTQVRFAAVKGTRGGDSLGVKDGAVTANLEKKGSHFEAAGDAALAGVTFNGKTADASFAYRLSDRDLEIRKGKADFGGMKITAARLTGRMPETTRSGSVARSPLFFDLDGVSVQRGALQLRNVSGEVRGSMLAAGREKWLEGTADLASTKASWQGTEVAAPLLHATFSKSGADGKITGRLLGGTVAGRFSANPFAPGAGAMFHTELAGAEAGQSSRFFPKSATLRPTAGVLDLKVSGNYSSRSGLACRFDGKGAGITVADARGKSALSGASFSASGRVAGGTVTIAEAGISPGQGVALQVKGEVAEALSQSRRGTLVLTLAPTPIVSVVDSLINLAPPMLQEASLDGTVALESRVQIGAGRNRVDGEVSVSGGKVEVPSQKLLLSAIRGKVPFSLLLGGKGATQPTGRAEFSRENYPHLLALLKEGAAGGEVVTIDKIVLGTLELGKTTLELRAANGLTEIASLRTTLYEGAILGTGYIAGGKKLTYRGDLLVNGLSLKTLCRTLDVQGYISGKVDGVMSVRGVGGGTKGMTGFLHLWAREGAGEKMLVSKEFLQRLAKQKLSGFFLSSDRPYDQAEIKATLAEGDLTFNTLKIVNTNFFGVRDLNVAIAPAQNRITLDHLFSSIKEAALRGKPAADGKVPPKEGPSVPEAVPEFKWEE